MQKYSSVTPSLAKDHSTLTREIIQVFSATFHFLEQFATSKEKCKQTKFLSSTCPQTYFSSG